MVSEMAADEIENLQAEGAKLSVREIIRLNAIGCKAKLNPDAASFDALPRCAFLGKLVFREPTIGHELWLDNAGRIFDRGDNLTSFALRALALTTPAEQLPDWASVDEMKNALADFMQNRLAPFTVREVTACVRWCMQGPDLTADEFPPDRERDGEDGVEVESSAAVGVIHEAQALALGIPLADAMKMTRAGLLSVVMRAYHNKGIDVDKAHHDRAIGDFYATLAEIRKQHESEIGNGRDQAQV